MTERFDKHLTREEVLLELRELQIDTDPEEAHHRADEILCDLLIVLGYSDVVEEFDAITKWYA